MLPRENAVLGVGVLQAADLTRYAGGETPEDAAVDVALVHVLERGRGRRLPKINGLVVALGVAHHHKAAPADARVIHAHHAHAKGRTDECVDGIALVDSRVSFVALLHYYRERRKNPYTKSNQIPAYSAALNSLARHGATTRRCRPRAENSLGDDRARSGQKAVTRGDE